MKAYYRSFFILKRSFIWILFFLSAKSFADNTALILLADSFDELNISKSVYFYRDKIGILTFDDILTGKFNPQFERNKKENLNFGNQQVTYWNKFTIVNNASLNTRWMLIIDDHSLDTVVYYFKDTSGKYISISTGRSVHYDDRKYKSNTYAFDLPIVSGDTQVFYIKLTSYLLIYPLKVVKYEKFVASSMGRNIFQGMFVGFFLMIMLYNLFLYSGVRYKNYLYYIAYAFCNVLFICDMRGFMDIFWQGSLSFMWDSVPAFAAFNGISMMFFSRNILEFDKHFNFANKAINYVFLPMAGAVLIFFLADLKLYASVVNQYGAILLFLFMFFSAIIVYRRGFRPARFYIIACTSFFIAACSYAGTLLGILPVYKITPVTLEIGAGLEMLLFSFALADKIREYKKEKALAEKELMSSLKENELLILNQNKMLEIKVEERTKDLMVEKEKSDNLLLNILPSEIADELKENGRSEAKMFDNVSVLFTDFVNFTGVSEKFTPTALVHEINHCFTAFDNMVGRIGLEKIKTIGDAYLAVCGLPVADPDHAIKTIQLAMEIRAFIDDYYKSGGPFQIRIGVHSGPLVAGIVGVKKFAYDIWGDTVNTAARMEQNSEAGKINISGATYLLIKDHALCTHRGKIAAKNKGEIDMYFVEGIKDDGGPLLN